MEKNTITKELFQQMYAEFKVSPNILQIANRHNVSYSALYGRIKLLHRDRVIDENIIKHMYTEGESIESIAKQLTMTPRQVRKVVNIVNPETERHHQVVTARIAEAVNQYLSNTQRDINILVATYKVPRTRLEKALEPHGYIITPRVNKTREQVVKLFVEEGLSRYEIRDKLGVAYSTVFNYTKGMRNAKFGRW